MNLEELATLIAEHRVVLFAGAGISIHLGLPSFRQLVAHIADELGFDPDVFETFGDYPQLAEFYEKERGGIGPLRSWMDTKWHSSGIDIRTSKIHSLIVELDFPLIYTTNYDRWLERAFDAAGKRYTKIAKVADLTTHLSGTTEIIKFHGDFDQDDTIVLTERSYQKRLSFETALDIRLRSDSLARPLLFLGYSLSDVNIRYLLYKLHELWIGNAEQRPKSYIFLTRRNPVQETLLALRGIEPIVGPGETQELALTSFLEELRRLVNAITH
jgi:hypothetical protein